MNEQYDIIVVGAGISGIMAAVSAGRLGANVLIVEKYGFPGGMLTAAGVGPMMTFHAGEKQVVRGITDELIQRLKAKGKSTGHIFDTTLYTYTVTPFDMEGMKHELELMALEAGCEFLYHTMLADVNVADNYIKSITVCNKEGLTKLSAKIYIDATGDADLSFMAKVPCQLGRETDNLTQPMTMNMKMANVDIEKVKEYVREHEDEFKKYQGKLEVLDKGERLSIGGFTRILKQAQEDGVITFEREAVLFFETNNKNEVIVNTTRVPRKWSVKAKDLSDAEILGRKQVREMEVFLKKYMPGFENSYLVYSGPQIGIRSSRHIRGTYILNEHELIDCVKFPDVIAHGGYPIDVHTPEGHNRYVDWSKVRRHLKYGQYYSIPYRTLTNDYVYNLITVGRCISTTFEAQGAIRVTPIVGAIGHAGGCAAGLMIRQGINKATDLDYQLLQKTLIKQGAYLDLDEGEDRDE